MVIKREVAYGIVQGLSDFWKCGELQDFTVTLGTTKFGCHRFLLAACSGYFRGLFRSGMKETELKNVNFEDISSETFELILESIYTGHGVLTNDNVTDIWRAAHRLGIEFLVKECENFVIKSLSVQNYVNYYKVGKFLNAVTVVDVVWAFFLKTFTTFSKEQYFLELPMPDVLRLVKSQDLVVSSEDDVLKAILQWVEHNPSSERVNSTGVQDKEHAQDLVSHEEGNETKCSKSSQENISGCILSNSGIKEHNLFALMSRARTCHASSICLEMMLGHPLVTNDKQTRDLVTRALVYQLQIGKRNGQWPTAAILRSCSCYENVAIAVEQPPNTIPQIKVFSFSRNKWVTTNFNNISRKEIAHLAVVDKSLYSFFISENSRFNEDNNLLSMFELRENSWCEKSEKYCDLKMFPLDIRSVAVVNNFIYMLHYKMKSIWRLDPKSQTYAKLADIPDDQPICHIMTYEQLILVFYSVSVVGVDETAIGYYDTSKNTWARLNNLEGPAKGMISFKDDHATYILQPNGDVWKLVKAQSDQLDFEHLIRLWNCDWSLHGAVTFMDKLYIYGVRSEALKDDPQLRKSLPGVFRKIIYLESESTASSTFIPFIIDRKCIK
uniref:BTB domain-containing protein n=1 Tax=Biomphalaria glabrata TaxID=6526 RepID=A0A2C9L327_BIOGL